MPDPKFTWPGLRRVPRSYSSRHVTVGSPAAYVNAIRRLSAVLAVGLGRALFGEPDLGRRLAAAVLASAGAACLLLAD